jgi:glycosyltransferase involved in cell wall biosynthesis
MPKSETVAWLSNCELSLFTTLDNEVQDTCSPNKIFDSFAAGKPIIQTTRGWIKELVEQSNCGINADPRNPEDFAKKINYYFNLETEKKEQMKKAALKLAKNQFNRDLLSIKYINILNVK